MAKRGSNVVIVYKVELSTTRNMLKLCQWWKGSLFVAKAFALVALIC